MADMKVLWDRSKDILSLLVIPLLLWGIKLEVSNALQDERISVLQEELDQQVEEVRNEVDEAKGIDAEVRANSSRLIAVETKLDIANALLGDIKDELDEL